MKAADILRWLGTAPACRAPDGDTRRPGRAWWIVLGTVVLASFGAYLLRAHYAKVYSDPVGFVGMALDWGSGNPVTSRAPVYPVVLYGLMKALGRDWVFLSNLPFVLLLGFLTGAAGWLGARRSDGRGGFFALLSGLVSVAILVFVRGGQLLELVNPFREPLAFSLALLSVALMVGGWRRRGAPGWLGLSGLCLGLAASTRETVVLMAIPMGIWFLVRMIAERRPHLPRAALFLAGLIAGMAPMFQQNKAHSGSALLPSYAAEKAETIAGRQKWDIPIPGMSLHYFGTVAPSTARKLYQQYTPAGVLLLLLGLARAVRRRNDVILALFAPAALLNLLFYCFYRYFKARYTLAGELFAIPIMAYGVAGIVMAADAALQAWRPRLVPAWRAAASGAVALAVLVVTVPPCFRDDGRTKVWHLARIREQILPHIRTPAQIMGQRHVAFYLAWILEQGIYEYALEFWRSIPDPTKTTPIEERLRQQGELTLARFAEGNYYVDDPVFALGRNWLELTPVFSFDSLTVPMERYGRPMAGSFYQVGPWKENRRTLTVDLGAPGPAMLMLDMRRTWDYPGRTRAVLRCGSDGPAAPLTNGVQFVALPGTSGGPARIELESDRPLPPDPFHLVVKPDDPLRLLFGMAGEHWAWNLPRTQVYPNRAILSDSCLVYDGAVIDLPVYASPGREVVAQFRIEFIQQHPYWRKVPHRITAETAFGRGAARLPSERASAVVAVSLGRGTGRLETVPVTLTTTLPSHTTQNSFPFLNECTRNGFVKIYDARIVSLPPIGAFPVTVDLGDAGDALHVGEGFYGTERSGRVTARWSGGRGEIRARLPKAGGAIVARWFALPVRRDQTNLVARFLVNNVPVPADRVSVVPGAPAWEYRVRLAPGDLAADDWNVLAVEVPTWSPARELQSADTRELGLLLDRVEIGPE